MGFLSERSRFTRNDIEALDMVSEKLRKAGKRITSLNRGDPARYFPTPKYVIDAYINALREHKTFYSRAQGSIELQEAIVGRYGRMHNLKIRPEDVIATAGITEGLSFINSAIVNPGDNAIIFRPYFTLYTTYLRRNHGVPILERYDENDSWNVHVGNLRKTLTKLKISNKIKHLKYILVTNPNNPTGTVLRRDILKEIVELANEYGVFLISDEIYDEITFNGAKFTSVSELAKGVPYALLNGISKSYDATGFRIGYIVLPENDKKSTALRDKLGDYARARISLNTPAEYAASTAINDTKEHKKMAKHMVKEIENRVNFSTKLLSENPYLSIVKPNGAFYVFPKIDLPQLKFKDDVHFVTSLLEKEGVQVVWGSGFGEPSHFRIVSLAEKSVLEDAINRINDFCIRNAKK
ncbi:MAG: aminotransferase class I/II-fold pyridoxal phosphate-dependent enzyme [Candidatus Marsarchaeota archaeon]|nr:aminotransferase class I/II-fold pyridoxal phosphate-dependent enzyme [Candidatus Marsarchaeota archaeon]